MNDACVVGLGHIGLPTAALLAEAGRRVLGCDTAPDVVATVNQGRAPFAEPGLDALVARACASLRLRAAARPEPAAFHVIAVPTPLGAGQRADLSAVERAADAIAPVLRPGDTVILESTVPVGSTERLAMRLAAARPDLGFPLRGEALPPRGVHVAHSPERVMPGRTLHELVHNDRVIGGLGAACAARAAELHRGVVRGGIVLADCRMAELVKLAENAFRDVNIAFANELSRLCEKLDLDAWQAIALANRHPRVEILRPGVGVGGHCIAVDPWFLAEAAPEEAKLIRAARAVNDATPRRIAARLRTEVTRLRAGDTRFAVPRLACLGLAYKPDVGDLRESPALAIAEELAREGMRLSVCDPFVARLPASLAAMANVALRDAAEAIAEADVVAILVAHGAFRRLPRALFAGRAVVDAVGLLATPP